MSEDFPAPPAGLRAGSAVAGYRLEAQVGAGGMAVVFRARDQRLGRLVALKVLAPAVAADEMFRRRFIAESRAAAAVDDPHIIPVYEAGEAGGALFIAMRFVSGGDLRQVLQREGPLVPGRVMEYISPVALALDAAHGAGLVHRDVKPANILIETRPGRPDHVYLSDFGVSKGAGSSVSLTATGQFLGTPEYSAPEQIQGRAVDGRTDQYALACVVYQLLAGVVPFERDHGMAVLLAHLSEPPPSLGPRRPDLPGAADAVLGRGMAKVPEKRYESCREFAEALREALGLAPYHPRSSVSTSDNLQTQIASPPPEFPGPAGAGTAAFPADSPTASAASATATMIPPVPETAPSPASSAAVSPGAAGRGPHGDSPRERAGARAPEPPLAPAPPSRLARTLTGHTDQVTGVAFSPDGRLLATTSNDGTARVWDPATGDCLRTFTGHNPIVRGMAFGPGGQLLTAASGRDMARVWDPATGDCLRTLTGHDSYVEGVALSPDGRLLATASSDGTARVWDVSTGGCLRTLTGHTREVWDVAFSPDGRLLATASSDRTARVWDVATGGCLRTLTGHKWRIWDVAFSPDGRLLATAGENKTARVWDVATGGCLRALTGHRRLVFGAAFSPDGRLLATAGRDRTARVWDLATGGCLRTLTGHTREVWDVAFSPDGRLLATASSDRTARVWD